QEVCILYRNLTGVQTCALPISRCPDRFDFDPNEARRMSHGTTSGSDQTRPTSTPPGSNQPRPASTPPGSNQTRPASTPPGSDQALPSGAQPGRSWSRTLDYGPGPLHAPTTVEALQALVARSRRIRALGTRHSFSTIAASDAELVTLEH